MIYRTLKFLPPALAITLVLSIATANEAFAESPNEPLSHLIESVERLRNKNIPQAYFWLQSPQVPNSTIFFPDTRGGAFVLIARTVKLPNDADAKSVLAEIRQTWQKSELPILDARNNRLLYYSDEAWSNLEETLRTWRTGDELVESLAAANQWKIDETDLILKIPRKDTSDFYAALMKAWGTNKDDFRCFAGWN